MMRKHQGKPHIRVARRRIAVKGAIKTLADMRQSMIEHFPARSEVFAAKHSPKLGCYTLRRNIGESRGKIRGCGECFVIYLEPKLGREAHGTHYPQRVLGESQIRIAHSAYYFSSDIADPVKRIDN